MIEKVWAWFDAQGYKGSISVCDPNALRLSSEPAFTCKANTPDDDIFIHEAIYEMDPDYRVVAIIKEVKGVSSRDVLIDNKTLIEVSFEGSPETVQQNLDKAILEGLAHAKILRIRESGAIVKFGYTLDDLL